MQELKINNLLANFLFFGFGILPFIILAFVFRKYDSFKRRNIFKLVSIFLILLIGFIFIIDGLYINPDAQGGLVIFIVPFIQFFLIGISLLILQLNYFKN